MRDYWEEAEESGDILFTSITFVPLSTLLPPPSPTHLNTEIRNSMNKILSLSLSLSDQVFNAYILILLLFVYAHFIILLLRIPYKVFLISISFIFRAVLPSFSLFFSCYLSSDFLSLLHLHPHKLHQFISTQ